MTNQPDHCPTCGQPIPADHLDPRTAAIVDIVNALAGRRDATTTLNHLETELRLRGHGIRRADIRPIADAAVARGLIRRLSGPRGAILYAPLRYCVPDYVRTPSH